VAYGYQKYGDDFWNKVTNDAVRFKSLFNKAIAKYSGVPFKQFRDDAIKYFQEQTLSGNDRKFTISRNYITGVKRNNVIDYLYPNFAGDDSIVVTKKSYKEVAAFYLLVNGKEEKIRVKNFTIDDYYSYNNGKIVYASYQSDPRYGNRDYSVLQLLDIKSKQQKQLTFRSKYFSPDINAAGTEILAVNVNPNGNNNITRLDAATGTVVLQVPNPNNYFFTQTKYLSSTKAIAAVRNPEGKMALVSLDLTSGATEIVTPFSFNVLGYPSVKGDTVFYSCMTANADNVFAVVLSTKKIFRITNKQNSVYHPVVNSKGEMVYSAFTAEGNRLEKLTINGTTWQSMSDAEVIPVAPDYTDVLQKNNAGILYTLNDKKNPVTKYRKSFQLFNFHSWRPVLNDPEYGYQVYNDNVLSDFSNSISYTYNYNDKSHTVGVNTAYAGLFPVLSVGAEESFNRTIDTAFGKSVQFNSATLKTGFSIPLNFIGGRTNKFLNFGAGYNVEQYFYRGVTKNIFKNKAVDYANAFFSFSNVSRTARQHINPRWAQSISVSYRDAFTYSNSHKLVANAALYFPGLFVNHSLVFNGAYQKRDSLSDLFSNTFSYARGYEALSTRRMYKVGVNYHFPICYPDWGLSGILYFQRIRANAFFDYNSAKARLLYSNGTSLLTEIKNRSTGGELYFDTKVWNSLPVSIGIRFSHLLDVDLLNPTVKNKWEIIIPIGLIPN
jgi:nucleoid DNA-binding protein